MGFLTRERPDIRKLLTWAETQSKDSLEAEFTAHAARIGVADLAAVEYAIHDGIKVIILDSSWAAPGTASSVGASSGGPCVPNGAAQHPS